MPTRKSESKIRSGRFKIETASTTQKVLVACKGAIYRVFNSGKKTFTVTPEAVPLSVDENCSLDFFVDRTPVEVTTGGAGNVPAQGIYDVVKNDSEIRSGHFKFKGEATGTPLSDHPILSLAGRGATQKLIYRIYNSGETSLKVTWGVGVNANATLLPEQSIDIVPADDGAISIAATAHSEVVTGIYEYLGQP